MWAEAKLQKKDIEFYFKPPMYNPLPRGITLEWYNWYRTKNPCNDEEIPPKGQIPATEPTHDYRGIQFDPKTREHRFKWCQLYEQAALGKSVDEDEYIVSISHQPCTTDVPYYRWWKSIKSKPENANLTYKQLA